MKLTLRLVDVSVHLYIKILFRMNLLLTKIFKSSTYNFLYTTADILFNGYQFSINMFLQLKINFDIKFASMDKIFTNSRNQEFLFVGCVPKELE